MQVTKLLLAAATLVSFQTLATPLPQAAAAPAPLSDQIEDFGPDGYVGAGGRPIVIKARAAETEDFGPDGYVGAGGRPIVIRSPSPLSEETESFGPDGYVGAGGRPIVI
ncbi:MAG: hypothetical protein Q9227_005151 [Pyrenula ochraceoflavens]